MAGIEGLAGIALGEFPCQLDALRLATPRHRTAWSRSVPGLISLF
jgi:hypothetical protein